MVWRSVHSRGRDQSHIKGALFCGLCKNWVWRMYKYSYTGAESMQKQLQPGSAGKGSCDPSHRTVDLCFPGGRRVAGSGSCSLLSELHRNSKVLDWRLFPLDLSTPQGKSSAALLGQPGFQVHQNQHWDSTNAVHKSLQEKDTFPNITSYI